jgi:hypothetical protein
VHELSSVTDDEPAAPDEPFTALVGDLAGELATLVRQELALATREMAGKARDAATNTLRIGASALLGAVSLLVLAGALVLALGTAVPMWTSALAIAAVIGGAGYVVFRRAVSALRAIDPLPSETFASLHDDGTWAREQIEATRDHMTTALVEVRRRLRPPPKRKRAPRPRARRVHSDRA